MRMEVSMRMHVSSPKVPKCICYAMHTQKVTFILIQNVVSKTKKDKFRIERSDYSCWARNFLDEFETHSRTLI
jgi:hypothetical protein